MKKYNKEWSTLFVYCMNPSLYRVGWLLGTIAARAFGHLLGTECVVDVLTDPGEIEEEDERPEQGGV